MIEKKKTSVYVAEVISGEVGKVFPPERNDFIENTKNTKLRCERYSVWKLLEYALKDSMGIKISELEFKRDGGRWYSDGIYFSLSHSTSLVAVAVSYSPVGVDIEEIHGISSTRMPERIFSEDELLEYSELKEEKREEYLVAKWSAKESLFKKSEAPFFIPKSYIPTEENTTFYRIVHDEKNFVLTVASDSETEVFDLSEKTTWF